MNNKNTTNHEDIPDFINLEEYNNLLRELDHLEKNQLHLSELTIKLQLPEVVTETIKLISNIFYRTTVEEYLEHCVLNSVLGDFDVFLRHHSSYEKLFDLIKDLDDGRE